MMTPQDEDFLVTTVLKLWERCGYQASEVRTPSDVGFRFNVLPCPSSAASEAAEDDLRTKGVHLTWKSADTFEATLT